MNKEINVLILDDEYLTMDILKTEINWEKCGITQVAGVSSVRKAKEYLKYHDIQILICDIEIPGENGLDLVEWATEYCRFCGHLMICIMLTCHPEYQYMRKALQLGCQDYLLKPVDESELEKCLQKAVRTIRELYSKQDNIESREILDETLAGRELIHGKVIPYIEAHLSETFSISELAREASLNPQYLMRIFKKETGKSVLEYTVDIKMMQAKKMLQYTNWSIETIAEKLGYGTCSYFYKTFKKHEGLTPKEYQKSVKNTII